MFLKKRRLVQRKQKFVLQLLRTHFFKPICCSCACEVEEGNISNKEKFIITQPTNYHSETFQTV